MTRPDQRDIERYASGGPWEDRVGYSRVVVAGDLVFVAGTTATVDGVVQHEGDAFAQTTTAFGVVAEALTAVGCSLADVVRTRLYLVDAEDQHAVGRAHRELFDAARPASTMLVVAGFLDPRMLVEVEAVAYRRRR